LKKYKGVPILWNTVYRVLLNTQASTLCYSYGGKLSILQPVQAT